MVALECSRCASEVGPATNVILRTDATTQKAAPQHTTNPSVSLSRRAFPMRRRRLTPLQGSLFGTCMCSSFLFQFLLLEPSFCYREEECAVKPVLLTVLTEWWLRIWKDVASVAQHKGQMMLDQNPKRLPKRKN